LVASTARAAVRVCVNVDMPASSRRVTALSSSRGRLRSYSRAEVPVTRPHVQPGRTRPDS